MAQILIQNDYNIQPTLEALIRSEHFFDMPQDTIHEATYCCGGGGGLFPVIESSNIAGNGGGGSTADVTITKPTGTVRGSRQASSARRAEPAEYEWTS